MARRHEEIKPWAWQAQITGSMHSAKGRFLGRTFSTGLDSPPWGQSAPDREFAACKAGHNPKIASIRRARRNPLSITRDPLIPAPGVNVVRAQAFLELRAEVCCLFLCAAPMRAGLPFKHSASSNDQNSSECPSRFIGSLWSGKRAGRDYYRHP